MSCKCIDKVDKELLKHNTQLCVTWIISTKPKGVVSLETRKVNNDKRGRPKTVLPSHCPFCGKKY